MNSKATIQKDADSSDNKSEGKAIQGIIGLVGLGIFFLTASCPGKKESHSDASKPKEPAAKHVAAPTAPKTKPHAFYGQK